MKKQINLRQAGTDRFQPIEITDEMTANDVKQIAGIPMEYELSPAVGEPPFGADEKIISMVQDGGKLIASPPADAGASSTQTR